MVKYEEGLAKEIVKGINRGEIEEPITRGKVDKFCEIKNFVYTDNMKRVILSNSEIDASHSPTFKKYFKRIAKGEYILLSAYRNLDFEEQIIRSKKSTKEKRLEMILKLGSIKPEVYMATTVKFKRSPDVVVEVLLRAKGKCEKCEREAPFKKKSDGEPYLEVHHLKSLSEGGVDTIENCIAVCPNCHREFHYGQ